MVVQRRCGRRRCWLALALSAVLLAAGCTYGEREPGLFDRPTPPPSVPLPSRESPPSTPLPVTNPDLPVAGEALWTSAEGLDVQLRFAVHAVRRVEGGTVLDWSITPIRAPNLRPGDTVPETVDLGLSRRWETNADVSLVDAPRRAVYRPLSGVPESAVPELGDCLCTPVWLAQRSLRVGVTTVLQVAFPQLPAALRTVDVNVATVAQFGRVPVTPIGKVPGADRPTDLTRPAALRPKGARSEMFRYGAGEQVFRIRVDRVLASATFTSLEWAIVSVTGGDGTATASTPPFASPDAATLTAHNPVAASGPVLHVDQAAIVLRTRVVTNRLTSAEAVECLCTDLRSWVVLRRPDKVAAVVTNYPALPKRTRQVTVVFAGLDPIDVTVTPAGDGTPVTAPPIRANPTFWGVRSSTPRSGWATRQWPTPVPTRAQFERYTATVDSMR